MSLSQIHRLLFVAVIGLTACSVPGTPAPVPTPAPEASASAWQWQSQEPTTTSSDLAITGGSSAAASPSVSPSSEAAEPATRRLAFQPGVAGQPMAGVGECVDLQQAPDGHTTFMAKACTEPHQAQVVGYIDVHDGPKAPAPPLGKLQGFAAHHCPILGGEFIGTSLGERRDLTVNWTGPSRREWAGGARTLVCMLSGAPAPDGRGTQPITKDLRAPGSQPAPAPSIQPQPAPTVPSVQPAPSAANA